MTALAEQHETGRWAAHTLVSRALRVAIFLVPFLTAMVVAFVLSAQLPLADGVGGRLARWLGIVVVSTATMMVVDRLARKLLPLSVLLRLTLVFPDQAPSRFRIAMKTGTTKQLERRIAAARSGRPGETPAEAAERLLELVGLLSHHDRLTRGHAERVRAYTQLLGEELGLTAAELDKIRWAGLLHDVGKVAVPAEILNKPGRLTDEEFDVVKTHPEAGRSLVAPLQSWLGESLRAVWEHHERFDGTGYPNGLRSTEISMAARIVSVADTYDVMTSARSYKKPMSAASARAELARCSGSQFDPVVVRAFMNVSLGRLRLMAGPAAWIAQLALFEPSGVVHAGQNGAAGTTSSATSATTTGGFSSGAAVPGATSAGASSGAATTATSAAFGATTGATVTTAGLSTAFTTGAAVSLGVVSSAAGIAAADAPTPVERHDELAAAVATVALGADDLNPDPTQAVVAVDGFEAPAARGTTDASSGGGEQVDGDIGGEPWSDLVPVIGRRDDRGARETDVDVPPSGDGAPGTERSTTSSNVPPTSPEPTASEPADDDTGTAPGDASSSAAPKPVTPSGEPPPEAAAQPATPPVTTSAPETDSPATVPPTTPATVPATTTPATTVPPTTVPPTTVAPTTAPPTTVAAAGAAWTSTWYLGGPSSDGPARASYDLSGEEPDAEVLRNHDTDRDDAPGLLVQKDAAGPMGGDQAKVAVFDVVLADAVEIDENAKVKIHVMAKDGARKDLRVAVALVACDASGSCELLAEADKTASNVASWRQVTLQLGRVDHSFAAGDRLELRVAALDSSEDDMWVAFGTEDLDSRLQFESDDD